MVRLKPITGIVSRRKHIQKFIEEAGASQRNIVFPDTVRNGRAVDVFFWRGSANPTLIQRIAAWMFGIVLVCFGLANFSWAVRMRVEDGFSIGVVFAVSISLALVSTGLRVFRNGFARRSSSIPKTNRPRRSN